MTGRRSVGAGGERGGRGTQLLALQGLAVLTGYRQPEDAVLAGHVFYDLAMTAISRLATTLAHDLRHRRSLSAWSRDQDHACPRYAAVVDGRTLSQYAGMLDPRDDRWNLRLLLHEFGLVWQDATAGERRQLIGDAPPPTGSRRWDAFLGAYAEHLAYHAGQPAPSWATSPDRYLHTVWFPLTDDIATLRVEALVHAPAHFDAHGVFIARRELEVV
jgi:hypothetical protein